MAGVRAGFEVFFRYGLREKCTSDTSDIPLLLLLLLLITLLLLLLLLLILVLLLREVSHKRK